MFNDLNTVCLFVSLITEYFIFDSFDFSCSAGDEISVMQYSKLNLKQTTYYKMDIGM